MHDKGGKIIGTILFVVLISGLFYLALYSSKKINDGKIRMIEITGNSLLSESDYLSFTKLNDLSSFEKLSLPIIKDRFEKHPYISKADVKMDGNNNVNVVLSEKRITAVILGGLEPYLISDKYQVLPLFPNTKFGELPVISNLKTPSIMPLSALKNDGLIEAFKIIDAAKLVDINIYRRLAEINMRHGGDIILSFAGIKPPVIFGRGGEARKMVYLQVMWDSIVNSSDTTNEYNYLDLRFTKRIYAGKVEKTGLN